MRIVSLWLAAVLITFWLIALSWLAAILYGEIKKMDMSIKSGKCNLYLLKKYNFFYFLVSSSIVNNPEYFKEKVLI